MPLVVVFKPELGIRGLRMSIVKKSILHIPTKSTKDVLDNMVDFGPEGENASMGLSRRIRIVVKKLEEMSKRIDRLNSRM